MSEAMNKWCFHGIALDSDDEGFILCKPEIPLAKSTLSNKRYSAIDTVAEIISGV